MPILLSSLRLNRPITLPITLGAVALTLLNLFIPLTKVVDFVDIINRLIAGAALVTTGLLANYQPTTLRKNYRSSRGRVKISRANSSYPRIFCLYIDS